MPQSFGFLRRLPYGFTIVESVIVLLVLAISAIGIASFSSNLFNSDGTNRTLQNGVKLLQECAEQVLMVRKHNGFKATALTSSVCNSLGNSDITFNVTISLGNSTTSTPLAACPYATTEGDNYCKLVNISVTTGGQTHGPVTLLLVGP